MIKKIFLLLTLFITSELFSQEALPLDLKSMVYMYKGSLNSQYGNNVVTIDDNLHIKNYIGSPLLLEKWSKAEALFNDGKLYSVSNVNYDALDDLFLIYLKDLNSDFNGIASKDFPLVALTSNNLIAIALTNETGTRRFVQVSPGHFVASKPKTKFFEYFTVKPKDVMVLKSIYKKVKKNHMKEIPYSDSTEDFEFKTFSTYYIKNKNKLFVPVRLGKKSVLHAINDSGAVKTLKKYIKNNHLKMNKPKNVQKLLEFYFKELKK